MFGSHLSIAGGLHNALVAARRLEMDCVQVFTKNQRQWRSPPLTRESIDLWSQHRRETGIDHVVTHDTYLINLASPDDAAWDKSIALFRDEIERCEQLAIPLLVTHPGAHMGSGDDAGLRRVAQALDRVHAELPGYRTLTCLENTAGQGSSLGHRIEHLKRIIDAVAQPERVALCIDTAHALEAGYDLTSGEGAAEFLAALDGVLGMERVRAMHINDSKTPRGSRVDRHAHIGHGHVSLDAFAAVVNHPALAAVPKILETPKEKTADGREWDEINLRVLRNLVASKS